MTLNELLGRCESPIERHLLQDLYPRLAPHNREDLVSQYLIDSIPGLVTLPDFAFPTAKVAIYCDGFSFHNTRKAFTRDREQLRELQLQGWLVLRFSGQEILEDVDNTVDTILKACGQSNDADPSYRPVQTDGEIAHESIKGLGDFLDTTDTLLNLKARERSNDAIAYYNRGVAYQRKFDYDNAISDLTQAILLKPDYAQAYSSRGLNYFGKGNYDRAISDLTQAILLEPNDADAYVWRRLVYLRKGKYKRAIADSDKASALRNSSQRNHSRYAQSHADSDKATWPKFYYAYFGHGKAYLNRGDYDNAIENLTQAILLKPDKALAYFWRGKAYLDKGNYDSTITDLTQAILLKPDYVNAYVSRANAYYKKEDYDNAISDLTEAIELKPDDAYAYFGRGRTYYYKGDYDNAILDFTKAIELKPDDAYAYFGRGRTYYYKGDYDNAILDFT